MTDNEFRVLCNTIEYHMARLRQLQAIHRRETGRDYVPPCRVDESWVRVQEQLDRDEARNRDAVAAHEASIDIRADGGGVR